MKTTWALSVALLSILLAANVPSTAHGALSVFIDFTSDIGNGAGGSANGTADWIDNLNVIATASGIALFSPGERTTIETSIKSQLETIYAAYPAVTFSPVLPGGPHERINFGAFDATPGSLGIATGLDFMNLFASTGTEATAARVFSNNFAFFVESGDPRATIISELTTALAGTGAHELAHSVGAQHHHSYGDPGITPANYANTGGIQNTHIMATGQTGISEAERETPRTLSQWENLMLESAGGAISGLHGVTGTSLAATVLAESDSFTAGDIGGTPAAAKALSLSFLPVSGLNAANTVSTLSTDADVDFYKFTVTGVSRLLADLWSENLYLNSFDGMLRLYDTDGTTVLASFDNTTYNGNAFNNGTHQGFDPSLLNISLPGAGTYFLEVSSVGNHDASSGGAYNLVFGVAAAAIPEAQAWLALSVVSAVVVGASAWRRKPGREC